MRSGMKTTSKEEKELGPKPMNADDILDAVREVLADAGVEDEMVPLLLAALLISVRRRRP